MTRVTILALVGLMAGSVPAGFGADLPLSIAMENWAPYYQPAVAVVPPDTPIQWVNPTPSSHTIRHDGCATGGPCAFDSGAVRPQGEYTLPGLPPGRYSYHCELHPIMRGVVIVGDHAVTTSGSGS